MVVFPVLYLVKDGSPEPIFDIIFAIASDRRHLYERVHLIVGKCRDLSFCFRNRLFDLRDIEIFYQAIDEVLHFHRSYRFIRGLSGTSLRIYKGLQFTFFRIETIDGKVSCP